MMMATITEERGAALDAARSITWLEALEKVLRELDALSDRAEREERLRDFYDLNKAWHLIHNLCSDARSASPQNEVGNETMKKPKASKPATKTAHSESASTSASAPRGLGSFTPTSAWDEASKVLSVTLDREQMIALTRDAAEPTNNSESAQWGRALLREISSLYEKHCEEHGTCEVRILRRRYDSAPV